MRVLYKVNKFKIFMWMMWINLVYKGWSGLKVLGMRLIWVIGIKEMLINVDVMLINIVLYV